MSTEVMNDVLLEPARVLEVVGGRVKIVRTQGETWALLALAYPYEPEPDDAGTCDRQQAVYLIGVLTGRGKSRFRVPGDLEIEAGEP